MTPLIRVNLECGTDQNICAGREPCQGGWYEWAGKNYCVDKNVLDVGAGMCEGLKILESKGAKSVNGFDVDARLKHLSDKLIVGDILHIPSKSYDVVTCFDVIEHVIRDTEFFNIIRDIARELLIITTPNFSRSKAQNHFHCREYTIPQFVNYFSPTELWTASPDGRIHHTLLLKQRDMHYIDLTKENVTYSIKEVPENISFTHSTVDGKEWAHMCGVFHLK